MGPESDDARKAVLITEAAPSLEDQRRARVRRYSILMGFRIPALILAAWAYSSLHSAIVAIAIIGASIPLPWMAVLIANDRPPRRKNEPSRYPTELREQRALETRAERAPDQGPTVIDGDV